MKHHGISWLVLYVNLLTNYDLHYNAVLFLNFSEPDVSLTLSYKFNANTEPQNKKRKPQDIRRTQAITEYSSLKFPAIAFLNYLEKDSANFVKQCLR